MAYVAMAGLLFVPLILLMLSGWNLVKCKTETDADMASGYKKKARTFLYFAIAAAIVFGLLKIIFPFA